jgi:Tol biopolymer transport system component
VSQASDPVEAPVWFPDASATLYFSRAGGVFKVQADLPRAAPNPAGPRGASPVDIGGLTAIGHDHALSRDGQAWVVTDHAPATAAGVPSQLFVAPAAGGLARRVPVPSPAYARGFSPDGQLLIYAAERGGNLDVYTVARAGGPEHRLTTSPARDDGPEFSPDGAFIYFNSDRGGSMQVWRMKADGTSPEPVTSGDRANWCPHVSPDGRTLVFLSAPRAAGDRFDLADVVLRRMNLADHVVDDLATFYGSKGTMNVASFAPTSQHLAFVSYQRVPADVPVSVDVPR